MLITVLVGVYPPELDKAFAESQKLLADPHLGEEARVLAMAEQARILFRMDRTRECAVLLDKLPDDLLLRGQISLLRGRLALSEAQAMRKAGTATEVHSANQPAPATDGTALKGPQAKIQLALDWFRKAIGQSAGDAGVVRQANYLVGIGLAEQGSFPAAVMQMERVEKLYPDSPECMAAVFQQAEFYRRMGRHEESVTAYCRLMRAYSRLDEFHNPWISSPQIRAAMLGACRDYVKARKYNTALVLVKAMAGPFPKDEALKLAAKIYRTWADNLLEEAEHLPPDKAEVRRAEARNQLRRAGDSYTDLSREEFTSRDYPEQLWNAASAYFAGHDYRSAARTLRTYLRNEARLRNAQALTDLGEAELSLGHMERAVRTLQECIQQHPRDAAIYRARLLGCRASIALGDLTQAEAFLQDNLSGEQLTPAAPEWRDSLFALGDLFHLAGRDAEAIRRLEEALQRYPDAPQAVSARYLLADSSRRLALALCAGLAKEISSAVRSQRGAEIDRNFRRALEVYSGLQSELGRGDAEELTQQEQAVLRNARFALGDLYLELARYPEALRAYQSAANHYADRPEALDAYLQIAGVYRRMDRPAEARTSLEQARIALRRMSPEIRLEQTTNFNRKQWGELLDKLCSL